MRDTAIPFAYSVSCPACLAPTGEPCRGKPQDRINGQTHHDRRAVAHALRKVISQASGPFTLGDVYVDADLAELLRADAARCGLTPTEDNLAGLLTAAARHNLKSRVSVRRAPLGVPSHNTDARS